MGDQGTLQNMLLVVCKAAPLLGLKSVIFLLDWLPTIFIGKWKREYTPFTSDIQQVSARSWTQFSKSIFRGTVLVRFATGEMLCNYNLLDKELSRIDQFKKCDLPLGQFQTSQLFTNRQKLVQLGWNVLLHPWPVQVSCVFRNSHFLLCLSNLR